MNILRKQFLAHVGQTSPSPMLVEVERAEGVYFYTPEGKRYYDLIAGVSVSNVGHANPEVVKAVQEQAAKYMHVMVYGELVETPQVRYAKLLAVGEGVALNLEDAAMWRALSRRQGLSDPSLDRLLVSIPPDALERAEERARFWPSVPPQLAAAPDGAGADLPAPGEKPLPAPTDAAQAPATTEDAPQDP